MEIVYINDYKIEYLKEAKHIIIFNNDNNVISYNIDNNDLYDPDNIVFNWQVITREDNKKILWVQYKANDSIKVLFE